MRKRGGGPPDPLLSPPLRSLCAFDHAQEGIETKRFRTASLPLTDTRYWTRLGNARTVCDRLRAGAQAPCLLRTIIKTGKKGKKLREVPDAASSAARHSPDLSLSAESEDAAESGVLTPEPPLPSGEGLADEDPGPGPDVSVVGRRSLLGGRMDP